MAVVFDEEALKKISKGISLFNDQKYWECHEELEHWWLEEANSPIRYIYWAVIQVAASLVHYREGRLPGSIGLVNKAKEKLKKVEDLFIESPLLYEKLSWKEFKDCVRSIPDSPNLDDFKELYSFRFNVKVD